MPTRSSVGTLILGEGPNTDDPSSFEFILSVSLCFESSSDDEDEEEEPVADEFDRFISASASAGAAKTGDGFVRPEWFASSFEGTDATSEMIIRAPGS